MSLKEQLIVARQVKVEYEAELLQKANVVAIGIGLWMSEDGPTQQAAIVVSVTHKVPLPELPPEDRIPQILNGVQVQVQAVGSIKAH